MRESGVFFFFFFAMKLVTYRFPLVQRVVFFFLVINKIHHKKLIFLENNDFHPKHVLL